MQTVNANEQLNSPNKIKRAHKKTRPTNNLKRLVFFGTLIFWMCFSIFLPRSTESEEEKRTLAEFPSFTVQSFVSGDYFDGIQLWYSDTYPAKTFFVAVDASIREHFGFGDAIYGTFEEGDEIPDAPKE